MRKTTITIRIDERLKERLEEACLLDDTTITNVLLKGVRSYLDDYYKRFNERARYPTMRQADACMEFLNEFVLAMTKPDREFSIKPEVLQLLLDVEGEL